MKLTFIGAAHEVTGSCTLIELGGKYYLVDCGMEQGINVFENIDIPVAPGEISAVFLTHAHIDHSGLLPKLYRNGFSGKIYTTNTTKNLCSIMLQDSAHIQESEAEWKNRKALRSGAPLVEPLYTVNDALETMKLFYGCEYNRKYRISEDIVLRLTDVGHLLGSAAVELWLTEKGITKKIVFSGDVGNTRRPIIRDPQPVDEADYLVIESTYGNRLHEKPKDIIPEFAEILQKVLDRGGTVVIPSFAVGRTQEVLYNIRKIKQLGLIKGHDVFPVYVDSPLAQEATAVFLQCDRSYLDKETLEEVNNGINPIWFEGVTTAVTAEESKAINFDTRAKVIISSSGMCDAGRIRHHLKHNLWKKENVILFVGYQSPGSLGSALINGCATVNLFGEEIEVNAEIAQLHGSSGHADRNGLIDWFLKFKKKPQTVFVNHGEEHSCEDFKNLLISDYSVNATAPYSGAEYDLINDCYIYQPEGERIAKDKKSAGRARSTSAYISLVNAAEELLALTKRQKGLPNKTLVKFRNAIVQLIEKMKQ